MRSSSRVEAVANRAAVVDLARQLIGKAAVEQLGQWLEVVDALCDGGDRRVGEFQQCGGDRWQCGEGIAHATQFARVAQAVLQATKDALDIANALKVFLQLGGKSRACDEFGHAVLPAVHFDQVELGRAQPAFEQACAGGGDAAVHRGEQ